MVSDDGYPMDMPVSDPVTPSVPISYARAEDIVDPGFGARHRDVAGRSYSTEIGPIETRRIDHVPTVQLKTNFTPFYCIQFEYHNKKIL